jgi:hypothetical protein
MLRRKGTAAADCPEATAIRFACSRLPIREEPDRQRSEATSSAGRLHQSSSCQRSDTMWFTASGGNGPPGRIMRARKAASRAGWNI